MKQYTKASLIEEFKKIKELGWIENKRHGNKGGVGNTLEDLLGIDENNLLKKNHQFTHKLPMDYELVTTH